MPEVVDAPLTRVAPAETKALQITGFGEMAYHQGFSILREMLVRL
ncbi:hypothetical protein [Vitiosangium sp. GDMCC 1.1324]|nr:hypothetical protein [Vitiosangium sp. GDMCC 1.1324]